MDFKLLKEKMNNSIIFFEKEIASIRTSRANPSILDNILVDSYGNKISLVQLGSINVLDSNMITIQVWDSSMIQPIEKAIHSRLASASLRAAPIPNIVKAQSRQQIQRHTFA